MSSARTGACKMGPVYSMLKIYDMASTLSNDISIPSVASSAWKKPRDVKLRLTRHYSPIVSSSPVYQQCSLRRGRCFNPFSVLLVEFALLTSF